MFFKTVLCEVDTLAHYLFILHRPVRLDMSPKLKNFNILARFLPFHFKLSLNLLIIQSMHVLMQPNEAQFAIVYNLKSPVYN